MSAMMYFGLQPAARVHVVHRVDRVEAAPLAQARLRLILPHARLEGDAEVAIVLHVHGLSKIRSGYPVVPFVRGCAWYQ